MNTIRFDKISRYDRPAEPVSLGIPFAAGELTDPDRFGIRDGDAPLPVQTTVTARWEDGSVKWLTAHFQPDLPGNRAHELAFAHDGSIPRPVPARPVNVADDAERVTIDTGALRIECAREGFDLFHSVALDGKEGFGPGAFSGFEIATADGARYRAARVDRVEVVESGPVRALVEFAGAHDGEGGTLFDFRVVLEAWAGKPFVRVAYQFINREDAPHVDLAEVTLQLSPARAGEVRCATAEGHYRTGVTKGASVRVLNAASIIHQAVEHVIETFYGDFWADWCDADKGVCVTPFQAHQNFPKGLAVDDDGITLGILPAGEPPIRVLQGVAKTHRCQFLFHGPGMSLDDVVVQSLQFQYPDVAILPESWYRAAGVWEDLFPTKTLERMEARLVDMGDNRNRGLGMMHFGDGPDHGYTQQGRGRGDLVWTNNEYDFPHAMFMFFAKTGERRFRDAGLASARHLMDVDFCHHSADPLRMGGQVIHTTGHVTGGVTPSHEWTEGLLDYYHFTGCREALTKAVSIADNMLRHLATPRFQKPGGAQAREAGWAMRGLVAVYHETRERKYLDACTQIAEQFLAWRAEHGAFLAPYTSHSMVRVPFMIAIAVNALYRYHEATHDGRIPPLIVEEMRDMLDTCLMPDGRFFYKELPSLHRRGGTGPLQMEALAHAYAFSGDTRFRDHLVKMMRNWLARPASARGGKRVAPDIAGETVLFEGPGPKAFAQAYVPLMVAYKALADDDLLDELDRR